MSLPFCCWIFMGPSVKCVCYHAKSKWRIIWEFILCSMKWKRAGEGRWAWGVKTPTCVFSLGVPSMTSDCWTTNIRCLWTFLSAYNWREILQSGIRSNMSIKFHHETLDFIKYILSAIIFMVSSFRVMDYVGLEKMDATLSLSLRGRCTHWFWMQNLWGDTA